MKLGAEMSRKAEQDKRFNEFEHDCQLEVEGLNMRVAQLEEALAVADKYIPVNLDCISINTRAEIKLINKALSTSSYTWLIENDKAVEVKVLERVASNCICSFDRDKVTAMIDSRSLK